MELLRTTDLVVIPWQAAMPPPTNNTTRHQKGDHESDGKTSHRIGSLSVPTMRGIVMGQNTRSTAGPSSRASSFQWSCRLRTTDGEQLLACSASDSAMRPTN